jgi:ABC-type dipeptide/oligopeptide/nickel transport system ATPase component
MSWRRILAASLRVSGLDAGYGAVSVLHGVTLDVREGETIALLGTNGNGKSTLMKCIMGMVRPSAGSIEAEIDGTHFNLIGMATEAIVDLGIAFVPECGIGSVAGGPDDRQHQGAEGRVSVVRADGGTKLHPGDQDRRPRVRNCPRTHRV